MFDTNVTGLVNMTQAVLPIFLKRNGGAGAGDIINVGSIAGREPYVGGSIYCATKAAVRSFNESLRKELVHTRVRVMEIDPGQVETVSVSFFPPKIVVPGCGIMDRLYACGRGWRVELYKRDSADESAHFRSSLWFDFTATRARLMPYTRKLSSLRKTPRQDSRND